MRSALLLSLAAALAACDNSPIVDTPVTPTPTPVAQTYDVVSRDRVVVLTTRLPTSAAQPHLPGSGSLVLTQGSTVVPLRYRLSQHSVGITGDTVYAIQYATGPFALGGPQPSVLATATTTAPLGQQTLHSAAGTAQGTGLFSRFGRGERMLASAAAAGLSGELRSPTVALFAETPTEVERVDQTGGVPVRWRFRPGGTFAEYRYVRGLAATPDSTTGTYTQTAAQLVLQTAQQTVAYRRSASGSRVTLERDVATCTDALCLSAPAMRYEVPAAALTAYRMTDVLVLSAAALGS